MLAFFLADLYGSSSSCSYDSTNELSLAKPAIVLMLQRASLDICGRKSRSYTAAFGFSEKCIDINGPKWQMLCGAYLACCFHGFFIFICKTCQHFGLKHPRQPEEWQEA